MAVAYVVLYPMALKTQVYDNQKATVPIYIVEAAHSKWLYAFH